ncbi:unnamed protein product [Cylicocyclus nassatus]|uniref:Uncharacterized protein n=1 Tax=Cylicocyclus nassatus TaxID=53992 RepID=A0AA36H3N5_CYLNA|nr:unnamed protein product [Cylicocyclus nassatus]
MIDLASTFARKGIKQRGVNAISEEEETELGGRLFIPCIYIKGTKKARLPYVKTTIFDKTFTALIDSGSAISCTSLSALRSLNLDVSPQNNCSKAYAANGNFSMNYTVHVLKDEECPAPALLGSDFLRHLNELGMKMTPNPKPRNNKNLDEAPTWDTLSIQSDSSEESIRVGAHGDWREKSTPLDIEGYSFRRLSETTSLRAEDQPQLNK